MFCITRLKFFHKNIILSNRSICLGRPSLIEDKALRNLKLKQAKMQCEDNVPVFLKRGWRDKIIYWIILAFTLYNTVMTFRQLLLLSKKFQ